MILAALTALLLVSCTHAPLHTQSSGYCEAHGVHEAEQPMASRVNIRELPLAELQLACAGARQVLQRDNPHAEIAGCIITGADGGARAYYRVGDPCAMWHELCHAQHGPEHTERYLADLAHGLPLPHCPPNPLIAFADRRGG